MGYTKKYWRESQSCHYLNGNKQHKRICYDCGECTREGKRLYSELYG